MLEPIRKEYFYPFQGRMYGKDTMCALDDPVDGYPKSYARDSIPKLDRYPDGQ